MKTPLLEQCVRKNGKPSVDQKLVYQNLDSYALKAVAEEFSNGQRVVTCLW